MILVYEQVMALYDKIHALIGKKNIVSAYALDGKGLAAAVSKMAFGNKLGVTIEESVSAEVLYGAGFGNIVAEVPEEFLPIIKETIPEAVVVGEVNAAVANMTGCLEETTDFLERTVLADYSGFTAVSEQYSDDANRFKVSMNDVHDSIVNLADSISKISDALSGINATVGESTLGVTDIAGKTTDMVTRTAETNDLVYESLSCAEQLKSIVDEFTMD